MPGHAQLHRPRLRQRSIGILQRQREPDLVAECNTVDIDLRIPRLGREHIALNPQEPEPEPLVETQHPRVGGGGRDEHRRATLVATNGNRVVHEHPAHPGALAILTDCEALHLRLVRAPPSISWR